MWKFKNTKLIALSVLSTQIREKHIDYFKQPHIFMIEKIQISLYLFFLLLLFLQDITKIVQDEYQINRSYVDLYGSCYNGTTIRYKLKITILKSDSFFFVL